MKGEKRGKGRSKRHRSGPIARPLRFGAFLAVVVSQRMV